MDDWSYNVQRINHLERVLTERMNFKQWDDALQTIRAIETNLNMVKIWISKERHGNQAKTTRAGQ